MSICKFNYEIPFKKLNSVWFKRKKSKNKYKNSLILRYMQQIRIIDADKNGKL